MLKTIKKFKFFTIADYEKEEQYLSEMSKKGSRLKSVTWPGIYTFEVVEPEDYVYRLYLRDAKSEDFNSYIQMFADSGWEYLFEFVNFSYFRKSEKEANTEIFSDNESRLEMVKNIFYTRMLPLLIFFTVIVAPNTIDLFSEGAFSEQNDLKNFVSIFSLIIYIFYVFVMVYCGTGLYRLSRKYSPKN